jgi:hypothetical protein
VRDVVDATVHLTVVDAFNAVVSTVLMNGKFLQNMGSWQ